MTSILVIEDNKDNLALMIYLLNYYGYSTLSASDGEEGVALARKNIPDLIISDIQLPKLNGYEVAKTLKNDMQCKHIPLISVTSYAMVGDRDKIRASGFDAYISKPINPAQFIIQIESLLPTNLRLNKPINLPFTPEIQQKIVRIEKRGFALVVNDYLGSRELFKNLLAAIGFEVGTVENVKEAVTVLQQRIPDLILSDFHLPDSTGLDFLKLIRDTEKWKSISFIVISATHPAKKEMEEIKKLKANRFILSPIDSDSFLKIIKEICPIIKKGEYINP